MTEDEWLVSRNPILMHDVIHEKRTDRKDRLLNAACSNHIAQWTMQADMMREIYGNPFHPVTLDSHWLSSTVLDLAQAIYQEKAFDRMPILADALMDAGCDSDEMILHCRGDGHHVRGCWVVDLVLGKA